MSPGLVALGPGMFSVKGVLTTRLTLYFDYGQLNQDKRLVRDARNFQLRNGQSGRDDGGGTTHITSHQFHILVYVS